MPSGSIAAAAGGSAMRSSSSGTTALCSTGRPGTASTRTPTAGAGGGQLPAGCSGSDARNACTTATLRRSAAAPASRPPACKDLQPVCRFKVVWDALSTKLPFRVCALRAAALQQQQRLLSFE
eukprot:364365-Chlamydomonas_euryale.AAC.4